MIKKSEYQASLLLLSLGILLSSSFILNKISIKTSLNWKYIDSYVIQCELLDKGYYSVKGGYKTTDKYKVNISYFVNEIRYDSTVITSIKPQKYLSIKYNPNKPKEIQIISNTKNGFPFIFTFTGFVLFLSGFVLLVSSMYFTLNKSKENIGNKK